MERREERLRHGARSQRARPARCAPGCSGSVLVCRLGDDGVRHAFQPPCERGARRVVGRLRRSIRQCGGRLTRRTRRNRARLGHYARRLAHLGQLRSPQRLLQLGDAELQTIDILARRTGVKLHIKCRHELRIARAAYPYRRFRVLWRKEAPSWGAGLAHETSTQPTVVPPEHERENTVAGAAGARGAVGLPIKASICSHVRGDGLPAAAGNVSGSGSPGFGVRFAAFTPPLARLMFRRVSA